MTNQTRARVLGLYKQLMYMSRDYPAGEAALKPKIRAAFANRKALVDAAEIQKQIALGEYIVKELEMLFYLKKYRTLRQRYSQEDDQEALKTVLERADEQPQSNRTPF